MQIHIQRFTLEDMNLLEHVYISLSPLLLFFPIKLQNMQRLENRRRLIEIKQEVSLSNPTLPFISQQYIGTGSEGLFPSFSIRISWIGSCTTDPPYKNEISVDCKECLAIYFVTSNNVSGRMHIKMHMRHEELKMSMSALLKCATQTSF